MIERAVDTRISIRATPGAVWRVLTDIAAWSEWNPTVVQLSTRGGLRPGNRVRLSLDFGRPIGVRRFTAKLRRVEAARELSWTGGIPGLALATHWFRIEPDPDGDPDRVCFRHGETMRGAAVPMIWPVVGPRLQAGYERMNEALRARCE